MSPRAPLLMLVATCGALLSLAVNLSALPPPVPAPTPSAPGLPAAITSELPTTPVDAAALSETPDPTTATDAPRTGKQGPRSAFTPDVLTPAKLALDPQSLVHQAVLDQLSGQTELAQRAAASGDTATAEQAYERLLTLPAPTAEKRNALLQMGAFYKGHRQLAKAAAVYEKILALFPDDPANPNLYFDLGRAYRDAGLYDLAISRFYSVLNAAISQNDGQEETRARRNLSLLARFEIAEASYAKGDFAAASKFYSRLQLLELPATDRPTVAFKNAQSLFQLEDFAAAAAALRHFIEEFPASPRTPEARNLLARSFQKLKRPGEATETVLTLLRLEKKSGDAGDLARWQKETGRQVAAQFYEEGDFRSAATIYQTLATLDPAADWQWPIVYEIGLCFERLNLPDRAREAYAYLQRPPPGKDADHPAAGALPPALEAIRGMAKWRQEHLAWQQSSDAQLQALLGPLRKAPDTLPPTAEATTTAPLTTPPPLAQPASAPTAVKSLAHTPASAAASPRSP